MRSALARAAIRRGSSTMIFLPLAQGSSSSASGTRVVLPAPGGATSTADVLTASVRESSSRTASIGRGVSKLRGMSPFVMPAKSAKRVLALVPGIHVLACREKTRRGWPAQARPRRNRTNLRPGQRRAADAFVGEAVGRHVLGPVDIAEVNHDRLLHLLLQPLKIKRAVLHPFGDHH